MRKIASTIKRLFQVQYRLTVLYSGASKPRNTYALNGRLLRNMTKHLANYEYWTLYKRGPFGLREREIGRNVKKGGD